MNEELKTRQEQHAARVAADPLYAEGYLAGLEAAKKLFEAASEFDQSREDAMENFKQYMADSLVVLERLPEFQYFTDLELAAYEAANYDSGIGG